MANILVRTSIAAATALTISTSALALPASPAAAAQTYSPHQLHLIGGKKRDKRAKQGQRAKKKNKRLYPQQVVRILERRGFRNVRRVYFSHGKYYARARGHHGPVKLVVSARTGEILSRQRIHRPRHYHGRRHYRNYYYDRYYGHSPNGFSWSFSLGY
ncbi:MAG: hypothetical protein AAGF25_09935 [Pseudomonadota bacterium]